MALRKRPPVLEGLPSVVKVGAHRLRFSLVTERSRPEIAGCNGLILFDTSEILLNRSFFEQALPQLAANVVQHEVTHAINWVYGVRDGSKEEVFCEQHTNGLIAFLHDNPEYARWLLRVISLPPTTPGGHK